MNRYLFVLLFLFTAEPVLAQTPNVVFILVDDMGYGDLGCYGQKLIETPNIDKLAASGIKFTQFYAGTSVCAPSRASLMTGLHTGHTAIRGNYEVEPEGQFPIPDSVVVIPELFKKAGYTTGTFGKWGLGYPGSEGDPVKQGVDVFYGYNCQRQSHNYFPDHLWSNTERINLTNTPTNQVQYAPQLIQQNAINFIVQNNANPFFLYLAYTLPHAGLQLPENDKIFNYYKRKFNESPRPIKSDWSSVSYQPQAYPRAAYAAMVTKLDNYVGEVVQKIKELGLEKNTLIIFSSDNGPHTEGGNDPAFFNSSGGFRGVKRQLTEGGIRTPMIASWQGKIKAGKTSNHIGAFWDFFPTFSELTKQRMAQHSDGISILPVLLNKSCVKSHEFLYWEFHEDGGRQAVRLGNWKGIREQVMKEAQAPIKLYDLTNDPKETTDLASVNPEMIERIKAIMLAEHLENKNFPFIR
jgi:arylsulfatase A